MARGKRGPAMSRFCDVHPLDIADGYGIVRAILVAALIPFLRLCIFVEMERNGIRESIRWKMAK